MKYTCEVCKVKRKTRFLYLISRTICLRYRNKCNSAALCKHCAFTSRSEISCATYWVYLNILIIAYRLCSFLSHLQQAFFSTHLHTRFSYYTQCFVAQLYNYYMNTQWDYIWIVKLLCDQISCSMMEKQCSGMYILITGPDTRKLQKFYLQLYQYKVFTRYVSQNKTKDSTSYLIVDLMWRKRSY